MTVSEIMLLDPVSDSEWFDSVATKHIYKNRKLFANLKDVRTGEHIVYIGYNTSCNVLRQCTRKFNVNCSIILLNIVLYVLSVRKNLVSMPSTR